MISVVFTIILVIALIFSSTIVIKRWRKTEEKDIKSIFSSICLFLMAVTNILAYWFDFLGIISWSITTILLVLGAYCTRYIYFPEKDEGKHA